MDEQRTNPEAVDQPDGEIVGCNDWLSCVADAFDEAADSLRAEVDAGYHREHGIRHIALICRLARYVRKVSSRCKLQERAKTIESRVATIDDAAKVSRDTLDLEFDV